MKGERTYGKWLGLIVLTIFNLQFSIATAQELLNYPLDTVNGEEVYRYQVERSIGLYRIGINFNVPQSEIIRLNPQLRERGLHFDEIILLPTGRPVSKEPQPAVIETIVAETPVETPIDTPVVKADTVAPEVVTAVEDTLISEPSAMPDTLLPDNRRVIELALMLPFESKQTKRSGNAERMMEFYEGALLALHDLQNDSTLYRLRVYDTERSERKVKELCDSTELDSVKAILGLVYPIQIELMATWCDTHKVPMILPFSDDMNVHIHPYVLQFNSTDKQEADSLCEWLLAQEDAHYVAVEVKESEIASSVRSLRKQIHLRGIELTGMALRDLMNDSVAYALDSARENIILLHSDRYQQVRMLLPHLTRLQEAGYRIRIVSQYSWQKEKIALPQVYTSMFDLRDEQAEYDALWEQSYTNTHVSDSPRYDLLGYDLMRATVGWLHGEKETDGLQSHIRWTQVGEGGWQNASVKVVAQ